MTLFSELYNKVLNFFNTSKEEDNSKDTACNRLKLVLMQDRAKLEPALMEKMRQEMIDVISKYVEIDTEALDLNIEAEGESFALMLNIPVLRAKTREEIEALENIDDDDDDDDDETEDLSDEDDEDDDDDGDEEITEDDSESDDNTDEPSDDTKTEDDTSSKDDVSEVSKETKSKTDDVESLKKKKTKIQKKDDE